MKKEIGGKGNKVRNLPEFIEEFHDFFIQFEKFQL